MKYIITLIVILFSLNSFSQGPCEEGTFRFKQDNELISITLVSKGNVLCTRKKETELFKTMVFYFYVYQEEEKTEFDYMKISSKI
jgi:hypothetical protein